MPFQKTVNTYNPLAVEGDFASANPRASVLAGEGALATGSPVTVGRFGFVEADGRTVNNFVFGPVGLYGFIHREQQGLITQFLGEASMVVPAGFPITLHDEGDFFVKNAGPAATTIGGTVFADASDGSAHTSLPAGVTGTGSIGATFTATGATTNLTTSAVTGLISIGDTIAGAGVPAGTSIISQTSGTPGGAGVYVTSNPTTVAAATVTAFGDVLNVTAASGLLEVGDAITGTGVPVGATLASQVSGATGGVGVYTLSANAVAYAASTALTVVTGVTTNYKFKSVVAVGELAKISTWGN